MDLAAVPYVNEFLGDWAMRQPEFQALYRWAMGVDLHVHLNGDQAAQARAVGMGQPPTVQQGIAFVQLAGTLMKHQSSVPGSTSTVLARRQIRAAAADASVSGIMLHVESPGGTVSGSLELFNDIAGAAKQKPLYAYIEDLGASAAYFAAAGATKIFANGPAVVGSLGTYIAITDTSGRAEREGVKVHLLTTGPNKGAGYPGTKVTDTQLAEYQRIVNDRNAFFMNAVQVGRRLGAAKVKSLFDGRAWVAAEAQRLGLIDGVQSLPETFQALLRAAGTPPQKPSANSHQMTIGAIQTFDAAVKEVEKTGRSRFDAVAVVARRDPKLHAAYLAEYNARQRAARRR